MRLRTQKRKQLGIYFPSGNFCLVNVKDLNWFWEIKIEKRNIPTRKCYSVAFIGVVTLKNVLRSQKLEL